jgi:hypothetical protein
MEIAPHEQLELIDRFYAYGDNGPPNEKIAKIAPPVEKSAYLGLTPGQRNRVLLDHTPWVYKSVWNRPADNWCPELWGFFQGQSRLDVAQLDRSDAAVRPAWMPAISGPLPNRKYLEQMAQFGAFIATHRGSCNHSVKDAAAIGLKTIVPCRFGRPYVPQTMIDQLNLTVVRDLDELQAALDDTTPASPQLQNCIDMAEIASIMDAYIQQRLTDPSRAMV